MAQGQDVVLERNPGCAARPSRGTRAARLQRHPVRQSEFDRLLKRAEATFDDEERTALV